VICQDAAYHLLLHARTRIVRAGGSPNTQRICGHCKNIFSIEQFSDPSRPRCRPCGAALQRAWKQRRLR
jgi:uncharacterized CHY-type Zn-finger protein